MTKYVMKGCFVQIPEIPKSEEEIRFAFNEFVVKYQKPYQNNEKGLYYAQFILHIYHKKGKGTYDIVCLITIH